MSQGNEFGRQQHLHSGGREFERVARHSDASRGYHPNVSTHKRQMYQQVTDRVRPDNFKPLDLYSSSKVASQKSIYPS